MKKLLFVLAIGLVAISVSACSHREDVDQDNNLGGETSVIDIKDDIKLGDVKKDTPKSDVKEANKELNKKTMTNEYVSPDNQEDLTREYSGAIIKTSLGDIKVKFHTEDSSVTVNNFLNLAKAGLYNDTKFHRVIKDFMIQGGDPNSKGEDVSSYGTGGPGYKFADEFNEHKLVAGSLAMANSGPNTNGSQFFIVTAEATPWLDGHHTNFGEVVDGMEVVKNIEGVETAALDRPVEPVLVNSVELVK